MDPLSRRVALGAAGGGATNGPTAISVRGIGGGGGGGGMDGGFSGYGGGGGAGEASVEANRGVIESTTYTITVGSGGVGSTSNAVGSSGGSTSLSGTGLSLSWKGGGGGGSPSSSTGVRNGATGACGGGGAGYTSGGTGGNYNISAGFSGGAGSSSGGAGGGGGMGGEGADATGGWAGAGGNGLDLVLNGDSLSCAGGGHGGGDTAASTATTYGRGVGGLNSISRAAGNGTDNTGAGGGGAVPNAQTGGNGGSGRVTISYPDTFDPPSSVTGTYTFSQSGGYYFYDFTGDGTITFPPPLPARYVEDVFSTYVYQGNNTSGRLITNGINLAGEGGMVWFKNNDGFEASRIVDTERGVTECLESEDPVGETTVAGSLTAFNADGFEVGTDASVNANNDTISSWTFRKTPGFFDVVTYTGDSVAGRTIDHNLGSVPGMIWVKNLASNQNWNVWHKDLGDSKVVLLDSNGPAYTNANAWNSTAPTATDFTVGTHAETNASGNSYVAYIFAHDDAKFGNDSNESIIKCGSYTGNGSTSGPEIDLGWEPQWILIKSAATTTSWFLLDSINGIAYNDDDSYYRPDLSNARGTANLLSLSPTGFQLRTTTTALNANLGTFYYMAIRRGLMETPTDATTVFAAAAGANVTTAGGLAYDSGFPIDWIVEGWSTSNYAYDRFMPTYDYIRPEATSTSAADGGYRSLVSNEGSPYDTTYNLTGPPAVGWCFRRAPGFFDVVTYTGTGANRTVDHSLGVAPELIITKNLDLATGWIVYSAPTTATDRLIWSGTNATASNSSYWQNTEPTSSVFSLGTQDAVNLSGDTFHAYLFASLDGISKVGTYTGTDSTQDIDCGFSAGARFVMIKKTSDTGNWFVWDTTTGITSVTERYRKIDDGGSATNKSWIDPLSSGFQLSDSDPFSAVNDTGATYIYLAIA